MVNSLFNHNILSIHDLCQEGTTVLGPGTRYVIWTQGCPFHCNGCVTPESRPLSNENLVRVTALADDIISQPQIEGITISGGEPFLQAEALADLLKAVMKKRPELTVIAFTGYTMESLTWDEAQELIKCLDLLIDGPYVDAFNDGKGLRGSSNQRLHFLTSRLLPWKDEIEHGRRKVEYHIGGEGVKVYGVPSSKILSDSGYTSSSTNINNTNK